MTATKKWVTPFACFTLTVGVLAMAYWHFTMRPTPPAPPPVETRPSAQRVRTTLPSPETETATQAMLEDEDASYFVTEKGNEDSAVSLYTRDGKLVRSVSHKGQGQPAVLAGEYVFYGIRNAEREFEMLTVVSLATGETWDLEFTRTHPNPQGMSIGITAWDSVPTDTGFLLAWTDSDGVLRVADEKGNTEWHLVPWNTPYSRPTRAKLRYAENGKSIWIDIGNRWVFDTESGSLTAGGQPKNKVTAKISHDYSSVEISVRGEPGIRSVAIPNVLPNKYSNQYGECIYGHQTHVIGPSQHGTKVALTDAYDCYDGPAASYVIDTESLGISEPLMDYTVRAVADDHTFILKNRIHSKGLFVAEVSDWQHPRQLSPDWWYVGR